MQFGLSRLSKLIVHQQEISSPVVSGLADPRCASGVVVVEVSQPPSVSSSGVALAFGDSDSERFLLPPFVGTVINSGSSYVSKGDHVLFNPERGKHINVRVGDEEARVIVFGRAAIVNGRYVPTIKRVPVHYSVLARIDMTADFPITSIPGNLVLVRAPESHTQTPGGIHLPDSACYGDSQGEVVMVGKGCTDVNVGDKVLYLSSARTRIDIDLRGFTRGGRFYFVPESGILLAESANG